ncbi:hypothetical protein B1400_1540 [Bifidobacterium italicum]|uniref:Uncharacterized protein n=1 Tax=Bifidobacterium italicum TaxID=1960968 RepID=A0A2A2EFR0_9BIFI|nr:hypothetical protein [Bifidobacterium italicum]PAU67766.1 hypothetical protein B1400_1540 [Bifidobacterium italicum]
MGVHDRHTEAYQPMLPLWQAPADGVRPAAHADATHDDARRQPRIDLRKTACFTYDDAGVEGLFPRQGATTPRQRGADGAGRGHMTAGDDGSTAQTVLYTYDNLPGPFAMRSLVRSGALVALDERHAYRSADGETLYGRAAIVAAMLPNPQLVACGRAAAWVWLGGEFPSAVDVLSTTHYRAPLMGRPINVRERRVPPKQTQMVGPLTITTPERTVCDLAMCPPEDIYEQSLDGLILRLLRHFSIDVEDCLLILEGCAYLHAAQRAREVIADFACIA